jgi:diamine N-acetyltransferase
MSDVQLEPVTAANWRDCAGLTVRPDQAEYVAPVMHYLCLCAYDSVWHPLAIVRNGKVVGFCMWAVDDDDASRWIGGVVIDAATQRTGVAGSALTALVQRFEDDPECTGVALSYSLDNTAAKELYAALGFRETGETIDNEIVARRARSTVSEVAQPR